MLYLLFLSTDAIAGISGGTTIKYIDTQTGVELAGIGNILGAYITSAVGNIIIGLIMTRTNDKAVTFIPVKITTASTALATGVGINIRVFYF